MGERLVEVGEPAQSCRRLLCARNRRLDRRRGDDGGVLIRRVLAYDGVHFAVQILPRVLSVAHARRRSEYQPAQVSRHAKLDI